MKYATHTPIDLESTYSMSFVYIDLKSKINISDMLHQSNKKKMCYGHVLETRCHIRLCSLVGGSNPRPPSLQPNDMPLRHWGCPKEKVELVDHYIGVPEVRIGNLTTLAIAAPGACSAHPKLGIGNKHLSRMIIVFSWHQPMFTPSSTNCELCQASNLEQILI
jgi:hypothetical protein